MAKCCECGIAFDPSLSPMDSFCPQCFDDSMEEIAIFTDWWDSLTPYQQDEYLRSQGFDPVLLAAETIILVKQLTDKHFPNERE